MFTPTSLSQYLQFSEFNFFHPQPRYSVIKVIIPTPPTPLTHQIKSESQLLPSTLSSEQSVDFSNVATLETIGLV